MISFRIDDIVPAMNWDRFWNVIHMLDEFSVKPLLGVVPDNRDKTIETSQYNVDFWNIIRGFQEDGYQIAMHGYQHIYQTRNAGIFPLQNDSEFSGLPYELQLEKIKAAKKVFDENGIMTDVFMAPSHTFDSNTVQALEKNGFKYITDGYAKGLFFYSSNIIGIPICNNIRRVKELSARWDAFSIVLHTNQIDDILLERYREICYIYADKICDYSVLKDRDIFFNKHSTENEYYREKLLCNVLSVFGSAKAIMRRYSE